MQQIQLEGWQVDVADIGPDMKALVFTEIQPPSGNAIAYPMSNETAEALAKKLTPSKLVVAPANAIPRK